MLATHTWASVSDLEQIYIWPLELKLNSSLYLLRLAKLFHLSRFKKSSPGKDEGYLGEWEF